MHKTKQLAIIFALVTLLNILALNNHIGIFGDDASYVLVAKSVVQGEGYSSIYYIGAPPHLLYPFVFPLLLAPVIAIFGYNFLVMKLLVVFLSLISFCLCYLLVNEIYGSKTASGIAFLVSLNPLIFVFSHSIMAEMPYMLFSLAAIYFFMLSESALDKKRSIKALFTISIIFLLLTYFTRPTGITLFAAFITYIIAEKMLIKKDNIKAKYLAIITFFAFLIPVALWTLRTALLSQKSERVSFFFLKDVFNPALGTVGFSDLVLRAFDNAYYYLGFAVKNDLAKASLNIPPSSLYLVVAGVTLVWMVIAFGFFRSASNKRSVIDYYLFFYLGLIMIWPFATLRFIVPILPFLFLYFIIGVRSALEAARITKKKSESLLKSIVIAILTISVAGCAFGIYLEHKADYYPKSWQEYNEVSEYASSFPEDARFAVRKCSPFYLWSGRQCLEYPYFSDQSMLFEFLRDNKIGYVVIDSFSWTKTTELFLKPIVENNPDRFEKVFSSGNTSIYLFKNS